jgi:N6-adenosine-specific RNA methylase IME4
MPSGKFHTIVLDPPWEVKKIEREERPNQGVELDYPTMGLDEIAALPVDELAEDACHLYLWVTQKYLPAGLELVALWGFAYQCILTWVKPTGMTPFSWMYNTEHVIYAHRGGQKLTQLGRKLSFEAPVQGHSVKPQVFYDRVIECSPGPRLEMFARTPREGFEVWGNEVSQ